MSKRSISGEHALARREFDAGQARALSAAARSSWREWRAAALMARQRPRSRRIVHQLRIATRRLLAIEELLTSATLGWPFREQLEPVFHAAGRIRDAQLCRTELARLADRSELARTMSRSLRDSIPSLARRLERQLQSLDFKGLRHDLRKLRQRLRTSSRSRAILRGPARAAITAVARFRAERRQLLGAARRINGETDDAMLHAFRVRLKRVRYMSEWLGPLCEGATDTASSLGTWQQLLGAIADQRALLKAIDRWSAAHAVPATARASLRAAVKRAERLRIAAFLRRCNRSGLAIDLAAR